MKTYIIAEVQGKDLVFRVVSHDKGVSPIYRHIGKCSWLGCNPYLIYGKEARLWEGKPHLELTLTVSIVSSGTLFDY